MSAAKPWGGRGDLGSIAELTAELGAKRDVFLTDVQALVKRKFLDGSRLGELKGTTGSKNIAYDVMLLVAMLRDRDRPRRHHGDRVRV